jgi:hypothetical protein
MMIYGNGFLKTPQYVGELRRFRHFLLYFVGTFQAGRNLYPYIRFIPRPNVDGVGVKRKTKITPVVSALEATEPLFRQAMLPG